MEGSSRLAFAYVVATDGVEVTLNLHQTHKGCAAVAAGGVVPVSKVGSRFGIKHGPILLVAEVIRLDFAESGEAHRERVGTSVVGDEPLRQIRARIVGHVEICTALSASAERTDSETIEENHSGHSIVQFRPGGLRTPALGAEAVPLLPSELAAINSRPRSDRTILAGHDPETGQRIDVDLDALLGRHVAVVGGTGQGKSCLTAAMLQQLLEGRRAFRCVVFDVSGEYQRAMSTTDSVGASMCDETNWRSQTGVRVTRFGSGSASSDHQYTWSRLPYATLGVGGIEQLLLPSERAQRPALKFALDALPYVHPERDGLALSGDSVPRLFGDCRPSGARVASDCVAELRRRMGARSPREAVWPPFHALSELIAEYADILPDSRSPDGFKRDSFPYGNVAPLLKRVESICNDPAIRAVLDLDGGGEIPNAEDPYTASRREMIDDLIGGVHVPWRLHILDLRLVPNDFLPFMLGAILQALVDELYLRGQGRTFPTLLVLEEAHHYIRRFRHGDEEGPDERELLAYERLAKEGRKFGVGLWLSTQRPSELSSTVLAQCGTWFCLRLTSEADLGRVRHASEWADSRTVQRIASLPRQEALAFGSAFQVPVHLKLPLANPTPQSHDPRFHEKWTAKRLAQEDARPSSGNSTVSVAHEESSS